MFPILYGSKTTSFTNNGLGRLRDMISCKVYEERNSLYECDFEYPVDGANYEKITCGRIIGVTHDETGDIQPFDIVSYSRPINGIVTFHAVHISYRQSGLTVTGSNINSLASAFALLKNDATPSNRFTYETDFTSSAYMAAADGTPRSVRQLLGGVEGSILDAYGGEYEWDKFTVRLLRSRGKSRDLTIRYGVNMLDYNEEADYSGTYTACVPFWKGQVDGKDKVIVASKVTSGASSYNNREVCIPLDLSDKFENAPTKAQLRSMAASYMASHNTNLPSQNIEVDFVRLQDMGEFTEYEDLMKCSLCDTIQVLFPQYNMSGRFKIVRTVWDVLQGRYEEMELGNLSTSLSEALGISQESPDKAQTVPNVTQAESTEDVASGTSFADTSIALSLEAGVYILIGSAGFAANSTGMRGVRWYVGSSDTYWNASAVSQPAMASFNSRLQVSRLVKLNADTTVKLQVIQNSGGTLSTELAYEFIRLA